MQEDVTCGCSDPSEGMLRRNLRPGGALGLVRETDKQLHFPRTSAVKSTNSCVIVAHRRAWTTVGSDDGGNMTNWPQTNLGKR